VIALIGLTSGCGRIGYDPLARVVAGDAGADVALDIAAGDSGDGGPADLRPVDLPPDVAPAASPTRVQTGAGEIGIINDPALGGCGSSGFMTFVGMAIPAGRNGHIQAQFVAGPLGSDRSFDARAFSGIRLTLRSSRPLSVSLKLPDNNTVSDEPGAAHRHRASGAGS
jgi:hypothetical protein